FPTALEASVGELGVAAAPLTGAPVTDSPPFLTARKLGMTWKKPDESLPNKRAAFEAVGAPDLPDGAGGGLPLRPLLPGRKLQRALRGGPLRSHALGRLDQRDVDLVVQFRAHLGVDHQRRDRERDEHRAAPGERQACTQTHGSGSRNTYPTPRTVW